jgi:transposase
MKTQKEP